MFDDIPPAPRDTDPQVSLPRSIPCLTALSTQLSVFVCVCVCVSIEDVGVRHLTPT